MLLYDSWNLLVESDSINSTQRNYVWGIDASGTMQGEGGVGGLLWATADSQTHAAGYDANGNIIAWVNTADGTLSGTREYGAFGENIATTGVGVLDNWSGIPFGFSTKYQDRLTGHYYYGYRFYDASIGRWLSKDPIEEEGGLNLYAFVGNNGVNQWDLLGMTELDCCPSGNWNGEVDYTMVGLVALFGNFSGMLFCEDDRWYSSTVYGYIGSVGIDISVAKSGTAPVKIDKIYTREQLVGKSVGLRVSVGLDFGLSTFGAGAEASVEIGGRELNPDASAQATFFDSDGIVENAVKGNKPVTSKPGLSAGIRILGGVIESAF